MFDCKTCSIELLNKKELIAHFWHKHRQNGPVTVLNFYHDGILPKCECGCGEDVVYSKHVQCYNKFLNGHNSAVGENNFKKNGGEAKSAATKKLRSAEGAYKGKASPEHIARCSERTRGENNPMFGKKHKKESKDKIRDAQLASFIANPERREFLREVQAKAWESEEMRDAARHRITKRIENQTQFRPKSQLEEYFAELLEDLEIVFEEQKNVKGCLFDFYVPNKNLLIEVDGDFYHVNPAVHEEKYPVQRKTLINDARKNKLAEREGYALERIWENDIKNNLEKVLTRLRELTA